MADAEYIRSQLVRVEGAGRKQWQAAAWLLERRFPGLFASNRGELAALRKQLAELAGRLDRLGGGGAG